MPHAGYTAREFRHYLNEVRECVLCVQNQGLKCIVGGDFNVQLGRGWRSANLKEFMHELGLIATNFDENEEEAEDKWTFRSSLGVRRVLDYVLVENSFDVKTAVAMDHFDLGSDHRAVQTQITLAGRRIRTRRRRKKRVVSWPGYEESVREVLSEHRSACMSSFEKILIDVADVNAEDLQRAERHWDTPGLQDLP